MHQMQQQQQMHTGAYNTTSVTTDHIQQYLDENKALILNILENQNTGRFNECAENQSRLQHNLMYLAAIADCQPKASPVHLQPYMNSMQPQQTQSQHMVPQSHMMAQSQTGFSQQSPFTMVQHHHSFQNQSQLGIRSSGTSGTHTSLSGTSIEGEGSQVFPDFSQPVFGDGSEGISRPASQLITKQNKSTSYAEGFGGNPQKKGKLNRAGT